MERLPSLCVLLVSLFDCPLLVLPSLFSCSTLPGSSACSVLGMAGLLSLSGVAPQASAACWWRAYAPERCGAHSRSVLRPSHSPCVTRRSPSSFLLEPTSGTSSLDLRSVSLSFLHPSLGSSSLEQSPLPLLPLIMLDLQSSCVEANPRGQSLCM